MSYDVNVAMPDPDRASVLVPLGDAYNHTANTSGMWAWALEAATGRPGITLADLNGVACLAIWAALRTAVTLMEENREALAAQAPPNGYGTVNTAINFLRHVADDCRLFRRVPNAVLVVSW